MPGDDNYSTVGHGRVVHDKLVPGAWWYDGTDQCGGVVGGGDGREEILSCSVVFGEELRVCPAELLADVLQHIQVVVESFSDFCRTDPIPMSCHGRCELGFGCLILNEVLYKAHRF